MTKRDDTGGPEIKTDSPVKKSGSIPWWLTIICATLVYCSCKYVIPQLTPESESLKDFFLMVPDLAPVLTIPLLLLAAKQLYDVELEPEEKEKHEEKGGE